MAIRRLSEMRWRKAGVIEGEGASSSNFWWRRWIEFALSQDFHIAVFIAQHLKFDMARRFHLFFHVDVAVRERGRRFVLGLRQEGGEFAAPSNNAHAAPTAAGRSLQHDG